MVSAQTFRLSRVALTDHQIKKTYLNSKKIMVNMIMSLLVLTDWQHRQTGYVYAGNLLLRTNVLYDMMT